MKSLPLSLAFTMLFVALGSGIGQELQQEKQSAWQDERLQLWNQLLAANNKATALDQIEKDLASESPHFLANFYWYEINEILETTDARLQTLDDVVRGRLRIPVEIYRAYDGGNQYKISEKYSKGELVDDPMALMHLFWATEKSDFKISILTKAMQFQPELFVGAWNFVSLVQGDFRFNDRVKALFTTGVLKESPFREFVLGELEQFPLTSGLNRLEAVKVLRSQGLKTPWLYRFEAQSLFEQGRFQDAFDANRVATESLPVFPINVTAAKCLIRDQQYLQAREFTQKWAAIHTKDSEQAKKKTEEWLARAMRLAGEHGRARDILKPHELLNEQPWWRLADREMVKPLEIEGGALAKWPKDGPLNAEMARLEIADGRHDESVGYAKLAYDAEPESEDRLLLYIQCLRKTGKHPFVTTLWENATANGQTPSVALFNEFVDLYLEDDTPVQDVELALELSEQLVAKYPDSTWALANLTQSLEAYEEPSEALAAIRRALKIDPSYSFGLSRLFAIIADIPEDQGGGEDAAYKAIEQQRDSHPWVEKSWQMLADRPETTEEKLEIWAQARAANPDKTWAWWNGFNILLEEKDWKKAKQYMMEVEATVDGKSPDFLAETLYGFAVFVEDKSKHSEVTQDDIALGMFAIGKLEKLGMPSSKTHWATAGLRIVLELKARNQEAAAKAVVEFSNRKPDSSFGWQGCLNRGNADDVGLKTVYKLGFHYLERRPFDGERIDDVAERHLQWHGSPVIAHFLYQLMSKLDPDEYVKGSIQSRHASALDHFGAGHKRFEIAYKDSLEVSNSERYIGWYRQSRQKAQRPETEVVMENGSQPKVTIAHLDGRVETRTYDPISGRVLRWQIGATWVGCEFNESDSLSRIENSAGQWISLSYDGDLIGEMVSSAGEQINFEYDANARPSMIRIKGMGTMNVVFDDDGEIVSQNVTKEADISNEEFVVTIQNEMARLVEMSETFSNLGQGGLPDLPQDESDLEELRAITANMSSEAAEIDEFVVSNDRKHVAISLKRGEVLLYSKGEKGDFERQWVTEGLAAYDLSFDDDSEKLLVAGVFAVTILDVSNGKQVYRYDDHPDETKRAIFLGKNLIASVDDAGFVVVHNFKNESVVSANRVHSDWIRCMAVSSDGQMFATGSDDGSVVIFDKDGKEFLSTEKIEGDDASKYVLSLDFGETNQQLVYGTPVGVFVHDLKLGERKKIEIEEGVYPLTISREATDKGGFRIGFLDGSVKSYNYEGELVSASKAVVGGGEVLRLSNGDQFASVIGPGKLAFFSANEVEALSVLDFADDWYSRKDDYQSRLAVAAYLVENLSNRGSYGEEASNILDEILGQQTGNDSWEQSLVIATIELKHELLTKTRRFGLPTEEFLSFKSDLETLSGLAGGNGEIAKTAKSVSAKIEKSDIDLLKASQWLPRSDLKGKGFWQLYNPRMVLPDSLIEKGARIQCIHLRQDGTLLAGTTHGLCVFRGGYWHWYGVDSHRNKLDPDFPEDQLKAESSILTIAETSDENGAVLWLGSANGLHRTSLNDGDFAIRTWRSEVDGLPTPRIETLAAANEHLFVGTADGGFTVNGEQLRPVEGLYDQVITWAKPTISQDRIETLPLSSNTLDVGADLADKFEDTLLVGTAEGVFVVSNGEATSVLAFENIEDAVWNQFEQQLFLLIKGRLQKVGFDGVKLAGTPSLVSGQSNVLKSLRVNKLVHLQIGESKAGIGVLTDLGTSIYFDQHFEHLTPPGLTSQTPAFEELETNQQSFAVLTDQGIFTFNREQVLGDAAGPVYSLATSEKFGLTFAARGGILELYQHDQIGNGGTGYDYGSIQLVTTDDAGRVYFNNGAGLFRIESPEEPAVRLFDAFESPVEGFDPAGPRHLTVTSDGTVWVSTRRSVFVWKEGMDEATEYSFYLNSELFPSRTSWVSRVIEGPGGRVFVICSDEGHLYHKGVRLTGGVLEWTGDKFERLELDEEFENWFMTSYTQVNEDTGIFGSTHGFGRYSDKRFESYQDRDDVSYERLTEKPDRRLWLGTQGAKFGDDVWLFGTAGGVVGWNRGQWFDPARLNWLLPTDFKAGYGSRHINDITTSTAGQIFVGTDNGLLVYNAKGGKSSDFLMFNNQTDQVLISEQQEQINQQRQYLINSYMEQNPESDFVKKWKVIEEIEQKQARVERSLQPGQSLTVAGSNAGEGDSDSPSQSKQSLEKQREKLAIAHLRAMQVLNREFPQAVQLLQVKPLDVRSVRGKLKENEAVVQYILTDEKLYIHFVKKNEEQLFKVDVAGEQIENRCTEIVNYFASQAKKSRSLGVQESSSEMDWQSELAWLYEQLLRPVISDLYDVEHVFVVTPLGSLRYLPFEALIRETGRRPRYAIQDHSFSYWPDMQFAAFKDTSEKGIVQSQSLVLGDPDGTLPGAKAEAMHVHTTLNSNVPLLLGQDASATKFREQCKDCSLVHLATHAELNSKKPDESYLLFADQKITVPEVLFLKLNKSRLVVLSACQTGLGANGLECATLARAFAHAGTPTVVATLWQVNDGVSEALVNQFYTELETSETGPSQALAKAKRNMTKHVRKEWRSPWMWAGYVMFGAR